MSSTIEQSPKRLFLLDAYALIFRGYYAFIKNPRFNSKGLNTSAILGFFNSVFEIISKEKPTHIAVVFDAPGATFRHEEFKEYKANRDETPEAIKIAVPYIYKLLEALDIANYSLQGYEADDIIGTFSKKATAEGFEVLMVTPDKDFAQLISEKASIYKPAANKKPTEIIGLDKLEEKFGVQKPDQITDFLGMMGDSVDNIPGLPGVGQKTALKFIAQYGSMETLFENTHELKGKMKEKVEANKEIGLLSKKLATINTEVPIEFNADEVILTEPNFDLVQQILTDLEFRQLTQRVAKIYGKEEPKALIVKPKTKENNTGPIQASLFDAPIKESNSTINDVKDSFFQKVDSNKGCELLVDKLIKAQKISFYPHFTKSDKKGIAFFNGSNGYYLDYKSYLENKDLFSKILEDKEKLKITFDLKKTLKEINISEPFSDVMLTHYVNHSDRKHDLEVLESNFLSIVPEVKKEKDYNDCCQNAKNIFQLEKIFKKETEEKGHQKVLTDIEIPLLTVLDKMEKEGIRVDKEVLKKQSEEVSEITEKLKKEILSYTELEINVDSPKQLGVMLFEELKIVSKPKKTRTGQYSTSEDILLDLKDKHPIVTSILEYRQMKKLLSTYIDALPKEINPHTGRIHTTLLQTVAATGRLSSQNPNLQNIPIRTEMGRNIRKAFVPKNNDYTLLAADYSQIELRIFAEMSLDPVMVESFIEGKDIHAVTASKVFKIPLEEVTREQRSHAKTVNFGIIYGVSAFGLSRQTDLSRKEAKELIDNYYDTYPRLKEYMDEQIQKARENGFVETITGRRRYLPEINSANHVVKGHAERNAINSPIQGSAADIIKMAMIKIHKKLEGKKTKMLLQVHDELIFDVLKSELDEIKSMVVEEMENVISTKVPLIAEVGVGNNWLEAH